MSNEVNHPSHYVGHPSGVEAIVICEQLGFNLGNAFKYLFRRDSKHASPVTDLKKARWYITRELERFEGIDDHLPVRQEFGHRDFFDGMWPDLRTNIEAILAHESGNIAAAMGYIVRGSEDCSSADMQLAANLISLEIDKHDV